MNTLKQNLRLGIAIVFVLTLFLGLAQSAVAQTPAAGGLFVDATKPVGVNDVKPTITRSRYVGIDFKLLDGTVAPTRPSAAASVNKTLKLNLFTDVNLTAVLDRSQVRPNGLTWIGHVDGVKNSSVTFTQKDNALVGNIRVGRAYYQVRYLAGTTHAIYQINDKAYPPERKPLKADATKLAPAATATTDSGAVIDVLVVYTPAAASGAGGAASLEAMIQLAIDESNLAFVNTPINPVSVPSQNLAVKLVGVQAVSYVESGDLDKDLARVQNPMDGFMDNVPALRDQFGADIVTLIEESSQYCGIAYDILDPVSTGFAPYAYNIVARDCMIGNWTFVHEIGHLMAARHDWATDPTDNSPYTYNHGYVLPIAQVRTIMAYDTCPGVGCPRVGIFSNPDNLSYGEPAGTPTADNRKTLNNTAFTVANFRQTVQKYVVPATPIPSAPVGNVCTRQPTFTWSASSGATWYEVWVEKAGTPVFKQWYEANKVCTGGACSATPQITLALGAHTWYVLAWNPAGPSTWNSMDFTAGGPPDAPTLIAPASAITNPYPEFKWNALPGVTKYNLRVKNQVTQQEFAKEVDASACNGSTCTTKLSNPLVSGNYVWMVQASSTCGGWGTWSAGTSFPANIPPVPSIAKSPNGTVQNPVTFVWSHSDTTLSYELTITGTVTPPQTKLVAWSPTPTSGLKCVVGGDCSYTWSPSFAADTYTWSVKACNAGGCSPSNQLTFIVQPVVPPCTVSLVAPTGTITTNQPIFEWNYAGNCTEFYLSVSGQPFVQLPILPPSPTPPMGCANGTCRHQFPNPLPANMPITWYVYPLANGPWVGPMSFIIQPPPSCTVTPLEPSGAISTDNPTFKWTYTGNCQFFLIYVQGTKGTTRQTMWISGTSYTPSPSWALPSDHYDWWIIGYPNGVWTKHPTGFDVNVPPSGECVSPPWDQWQVHSGTGSLTTRPPNFSLTRPAGTNLWAAASFPNSYSGNIFHEVTLQRFGYDWTSHGIAINGTPGAADGGWASAYQFQIMRGADSSGRGYYSVWRVDPSYPAGRVIMSWAPSYKILTGNGVNTLRAMKLNTILYFYINNSLVWSGADPYYAPLTSGKNGVVMAPSPTGYQDELVLSAAKCSTPIATLAMPEVSADQKSLNDAAKKNPQGTMGQGPVFK